MLGFYVNCGTEVQQLLKQVENLATSPDKAGHPGGIQRDRPFDGALSKSLKVVDRGISALDDNAIWVEQLR